MAEFEMMRAPLPGFTACSVMRSLTITAGMRLLIAQWMPFARDMEGAEVPAPDLKNEICQCVSRVLGGLKPEYREALEIVDIGDEGPGDLAAKANISANNATVRIHRARRALEKQVRLTCGACAEHGCVDCRCKIDAQ